jgi:hypothetical protein
VAEGTDGTIIVVHHGLAIMERSAIMILLEAAGQRLAETETLIRRELGAITATVDEAERSETKRQIEALQQERIEQVLEVQRLHDELDSSTDGGG